MQNITNLSDSQKVKIGYYSGVLSFISFAFFVLLSYFLSFNDYNPLTETISKLGITTNGAIPFIFGTVIGGVLISIYVSFFLYNVLEKTIFIKYGIYSGVFSGFMLVGVGIFQDKPDFFFQITHLMFAALFFFSMGLSILFISLTLRKTNSPTKNLLGTIGLIVCIIAILHFFLSFLKNDFILFSFTINIAAVWQKITVISYVLWHIGLLIHLRKTNRI